jgi:hypothetical protein
MDYIIRTITKYILVLFLVSPAIAVQYFTPEEAAKSYSITAPYTTTDGVAGGGLVPHAYLSGVSHWPNPEGNMKIVNKPRLATWYVSLPEADLNWFSIGGNITMFNRLELGFAENYINIDEPASIATSEMGLDLDNNLVALSSKLLLVKEEKWLPEISIGAVYKYTNFDNLEVFEHEGKEMYSNNKGIDFFGVASKMFFIPLPHMALPLPLFMNAGVKSTKAQQLGVVGFGDERDEVFFGSTSILVPANIIFPFIKNGLFIFGFEYVDDVDVGMNSLGPMKTNRQYDVHIVYDTNKNLAFILSYLNTGNSDFKKSVKNNLNSSGLGDGFTLSVQYKF